MQSRLRNRFRRAQVALAGILSLACVATSYATGKTQLNGAQPRPFFAIAHNPNTIADVEAALSKGFNGLEPDISLRVCNGEPILIDFDTDLGVANCGELQFPDWCTQVHDLAAKYPQLAYVILDIKEPVADPDDPSLIPAFLTEIVNSARLKLNNGLNLTIVYSVASHEHAKIIEELINAVPLGYKEGVQIDGEDDPGAVVQWFFDQGFFGNIGYGDGTSTIYEPLPRAMDRAAFLRASIGYPKAVSYVFTLTEEDSMESYINGGVDGIIPLDADQQDLLDVITKHPEIRMGDRNDNPFQPANEAYAIEVHTDDDGTNADIEFILNGCHGSSSITVDSGFILPVIYSTGRFEANNEDWVTMPSMDLGELQSITIKNHGGGLNPDWKVGTIAVSSARYIGPNGGTANLPHSREYRADVHILIDSGGELTIPLTPNFTLPKPVITCPNDMVVPNSPDMCGATVYFTPQANGLCDDVVITCNPPSGTLFPVGTTTVTCTASGTGGTSDPCTFKVTVQDTQAPKITCPAPVVAKATGANGAVVTFAITVNDNCAGASAVSVPASGSVFPIGDTTVNSTATDASNNQASCSFNVHVKGAAEQAADLLATVTNLNIANGIKNSLLAKLTNALAKIQASNSAAACGELKSFINEVSAQKGKALSTSDADALIAAATQIRAVIGCDP